MYKKIIPFINCVGQESEQVRKAAAAYESGGADGIYMFQYSMVEEQREEFLFLVKELSKTIDIPIYIGCYVKRFEDIKKALYTGASYVVLPQETLNFPEAIKEGAARFGADKIYLLIDKSEDILKKNSLEALKNLGISTLILNQNELTDDFLDTIEVMGIPVILKDSLQDVQLKDKITLKGVTGIISDKLNSAELFEVKKTLKELGVAVNTFESSLEFKEFKLNNDGLIPVVVQDYKTSQVLMVAYMNEEAFKQTIKTGKMTYFSRSRKSLWIKGETSGHFQYVKTLQIDCDKDTILAKVHQVGPACHTGSQSCFYTDLVNKAYDATNPLTVFSEVYETIADRKKNPKEGSYTNYLFEKGIDKILKKCGEEATEIIIAAKNPDAEELKYEISDFLYHMMVLMAECGLDWSDIVKELAHRR
jgi:phosphoribosyl-ATP pyrophosphohydrolase/phosphoribosyl-AMP cyclohydrolase